LVLVSSRFIHVVAGIGAAVFFKAVKSPIVSEPAFAYPSPAGGHVGPCPPSGQ
jgi:hypothetical protein